MDRSIRLDIAMNSGSAIARVARGTFGESKFIGNPPNIQNPNPRHTSMTIYTTDPDTRSIMPNKVLASIVRRIQKCIAVESLIPIRDNPEAADLKRLIAVDLSQSLVRFSRFLDSGKFNSGLLDTIKFLKIVYLPDDIDYLVS